MIFLSFDFQSNSDTYAVINLPGEEDEEIDGGVGGGGTVSLPPAPLSSEDAHEKVHHYSKIDKSKKRRPPDPPPGHSTAHGVNIRPHSLVPQPPIPTMQQHPQLQVIKISKVLGEINKLLPHYEITQKSKLHLISLITSRNLLLEDRTNCVKKWCFCNFWHF